MPWPAIAAAAATAISGYLASRKKPGKIKRISTQTPQQQAITNMLLSKAGRSVQDYKPYPGMQPVQGANPLTSGMPYPTSMQKGIFSAANQMQQQIGQRMGQPRGQMPGAGQQRLMQGGQGGQQGPPKPPEKPADIVAGGMSSIIKKLLQYVR